MLDYSVKSQEDKNGAKFSQKSNFRLEISEETKSNKEFLSRSKNFWLEEFGPKAKILLPTTIKNQDQRVIDKNH